MTESAFFASAAQKECYGNLNVEQYEVVGTFDNRMCDYCGAMDGKVFPLKDFKEGSTAPPFHPWCRCTTVPYFEDMKGIGERWMRDPETGKGGTVPADMTYNEWKEIYVDKTSTMEKWINNHRLTNQGGNGILVQKPDSVVNGSVHLIGKIDRSVYSCVTTDIITDEVVITSERIQHIKLHHPNDFERFSIHLQEIVEKPDYILEVKKPNTALILKEIVDNGEKFKTVLRLVTHYDNPNYKNSIITFMKIDGKEWRRLIKNKKILYKSE